MSNPTGSAAPPQEKVEFVRHKIDDSLKQMKRSRDRNQLRASVVKVVGLALASVTTVLLGLQVADLTPQLRNAAFVSAALVTLLSALEPFFNFRALWVEHERALWHLYALQDRFEYYLEGRPPVQVESQQLDEFMKEHQEIWDELSAAWVNHRKQSPS